MWFFLIFDVTFDLLWHMELSICTQKVAPIFWRQKFRLAVFKSVDMLLMKFYFLNLPGRPIWRHVGQIHRVLIGPSHDRQCGWSKFSQNAESANIIDRLPIQNNPVNDRIEANELNELSEHFVNNPTGTRQQSGFPRKLSRDPILIVRSGEFR
jgi:hypothetical protein